jgi:hypothetical protein
VKVGKTCNVERMLKESCGSGLRLVRRQAVRGFSAQQRTLYTFVRKGKTTLVSGRFLYVLAFTSDRPEMTCHRSYTGRRTLQRDAAECAGGLLA